MSAYKWLCGVALVVGGLVIGAEAQQAQQKGGVEITGPYDVQTNWPQRPEGTEGWVSGPTVAIFAESPDRVFFVQRGELPIPEGVKPGPGAKFGAPGRTASANVNKARRMNYILVANRDGKIVENWTQWDKYWDGSRGPHHIKMNPYDPERHVWIMDNDGQQVLKFTNDGKTLVLALGERLKPGNDDKHFGGPANIAFLPDGTFFVADGYDNRRVVKFDKDGKYLMAWGKEGSAPGEFTGTLHAIAIDAKRRIYVSDMGNHRIQVFDENGKFLDQFPNIPSPSYIHISSDQYLWVSDTLVNKFLKYDLNGKLLYSWGSYGDFPGGLWMTHQFSVDQEGNLYTAEAFHGRVEKFRPKPGADKSQLIAPERPMAGRARTATN